MPRPAPLVRSRLARRLTAAFVALGMLAAAGEAWAAFAGSAGASHSLSTAVLEPPSNPAVTTASCNALTLTATATVTWTATPSTWADGYQVLTSGTSGGPYSVAVTVSGQSTTTAQLTTLSLGTTTYVVVRATKAQWRSTTTPEVAYTAPTLCL